MIRKKALRFATLVFLATIIIGIGWLYGRRLTSHSQAKVSDGCHGRKMSGDVYNMINAVKDVSAASGLPKELTKIRPFHADLRLQPAAAGSFPELRDAPNCEKWVVVTSIIPVGKPLKQLQELLDWCVVVVGDRESPKDFRLDGHRSVYLDSATQGQLGYRIVNHTPWSSFSRKNIGYMFAIHHGARLIYDTDAYTELLPSAINVLFTKTISPLQARARGLVWNPYPFFGFEGAWPRGLPLDQVTRKPASASPANNRQWFKGREWTCNICPPPHNNITHLRGEVGGIWQFLVRGETDVGAVYWINKDKPFADFRTSGEVVSLSPGVMAPYNAQATLHHYDAFWGLLLPASVHGRVSDIWRAYFTQRVMWDVGGRMQFAPSQMIVRSRNNHTASLDFASEIPLYLQSGELVKYLQKWACNKATLQECLLQLYVDLYEVGIVEASDVKYMLAWLQDLVGLGYNFPKLQASRPIHWMKKDWRKIRLCIHFNTEVAVNEKAMRLMQRVYSKFFDKISYTGPIPNPSYLGNDAQYIHCKTAHNAESQLRCLLAHLETYPDAEGYLYISADVFVDLSRMSKLPRNKLWYLHGTEVDVRNPQTFNVTKWSLNQGYGALKYYVEHLPPEWKHRLQEVNGNKNIVHTMDLADVIYIPERLRSEFVSTTKYFEFIGGPPISQEIITPVIKDLVVGDDYVPLIPMQLRDDQLNLLEQTVHGWSGEYDFVRPLNLLNPIIADLWTRLMDDVETSMV